MNRILLVVDLQKGFLRNKDTQNCASKIDQLLKSNCFDVVLATKFYNKNGSPYIEFLNWKNLMNEDEQKLIPIVQERANKVINKEIYTCVNKEFIEILKSLNFGHKPKEIFICGIDTDSCVLKIAVDLFENSIRPIVLKNYCASNGGIGSHRAGIASLRRFIGEKCLVSGKITSEKNINDILLNIGIIYKIRASLEIKKQIKQIFNDSNKKNVKLSKEQIKALLVEFINSINLSEKTTKEEVNQVFLSAKQNMLIDKNYNFSNDNKMLVNYHFEWEKETIKLYKELCKKLNL